MKKSNNKILYAVHAAMIAAAYAAATYIFSFISYGPVQFRISEALTVLPVFTPAAIPGLAVGCVIANIASPYGAADILFGALASLLAALCTHKFRSIRFKGLPLLSILMPVLFNSLIIGAEIVFVLPGEASLAGFLITAAEIAAGELVVCLAGSVPVFYAVNRSGIFSRHI